MKKLLALLCVFLITTFVVTSCGVNQRKFQCVNALKMTGRTNKNVMN